MSSKLVFATLLVAGIGLLFVDNADARGRGRRGCNGSYDNYYYETAQAADGRRVYSYEPDGSTYVGGTYVGSSGYRRSNAPLYLRPKSDPSRYDAR